VTGWSGIDYATAYATVKYNSAGVEQWVARYDRGSRDVAQGVAVDGSGNVYVTGFSTGGFSDSDYATIKYNSGGVQQWVAVYNVSDYDEAHAIALDNLGNVYATGESKGAAGNTDFATVKYDANGTELWVARYDAPAHGYDSSYRVVLDTSHNVYVTGASSDNDYTTIKYTQAAAVGGIAELPAVAETGTSGMGSTTYAVLAGAAAGVLAFAVLATLSVKRWRVR